MVKGGKAGGPRTIKVAWSAPDLAGAAPTLAYRVEIRKVRPGTDRLVVRKSFAPSRTAYQVTVPKGRYQVTVTAVNQVGSGPGTVSKVVRAR